MNIDVNQFSYNFDGGKVSSAQVGFYGNDADTGEYVNSTIRVNASDLPQGKDFMSVSMQDMVAIARKKLAADTEVKEAATPADK